MPYKRVQLSLNEDTLELIDELKISMKANTRSEVVRRLVAEKYARYEIERIKQENILLAMGAKQTTP